MWTKQQIIEQAYAELALAGFVYDLSPELLDLALQRLDAMMAEWAGVGVNIGYLLPNTPDDSNLDDPSGIPDTANRAVLTNLAIELSPGRGKSLTADTKVAARQGYNRLLGAAVRSVARQVPMPNTMPRGAGNQPWRTGQPFFPGPADALDIGAGDVITVS